MKIAASFQLCALLLGATTAQECLEITEEQSLINELYSSPSGMPPTSSVDLIDYNINCLTSGCTFGMYRSLTVTVSFDYETSGTRIMLIVRTNIDCIFEDALPFT